ncbi:30S ribosomal protein S9, partial [Patescibacteria group bacterium]|nr:30S ribosomal protein S9 [Patescibacteria group bacterium]
MPEKKEKKAAVKKDPAVKKTTTKTSVVKNVKKPTTKKVKEIKGVVAAKKVVDKPKIEVGTEVKSPAVTVKPIKVKVKTRQRSAERRSLKEKRPDDYYFAVGRRKRAVAQTKLWTSKKLEISVNGRSYEEYFLVYKFREALLAPLKAIGLDGAKVELKISGGGKRGQSEAARLGISRALLLVNPDYRLTLKKLGFLMRDPREKERKKFGLKKARRAP